MNNTLSSTFQNAYNVIKSKVVDKQDKTLSSAIGGATTVEGSLNNINNNIQKQDFNIPASVHAKVGNPKIWVDMDWGDFNNFNGLYIWTDGNNIYYSEASTQKILNKITGEWEDKIWNINIIDSRYVWTDGNNIYYSKDSTQKILNKITGEWEDKIWNKLTSFNGYNIWTNGNNIYYSYVSHYVLDKSTSTWNKIWDGLIFNGSDIWTDGDDVYCSEGSTQYVLDKSTNTWEDKTWSDLTSFNGNNIWTDGDDVYYSFNSAQYVLDKVTSTWSSKIWSGLTSFTSGYTWSDGDNIYYSLNGTNKVLKSINVR